MFDDQQRAIRPMGGNDLRQVMAIEDQCGPNAWGAAEFHSSLQDPAVEAFVSGQDNRILGFIVARRQLFGVQVLNLAVDPVERRSGVGSDLLDHVIDRAFRIGARKVSAEVRESNLDIQLFARANGFKASAIRRGFYQDSGEDAYLMERPLEEGATLPWRGIIH